MTCESTYQYTLFKTYIYLVALFFMQIFQLVLVWNTLRWVGIHWLFKVIVILYSIYYYTNYTVTHEGLHMFRVYITGTGCAMSILLSRTEESPSLYIGLQFFRDNAHASLVRH